MTREWIHKCLLDYKEEFIEALENHCLLYKTIGIGLHESPMWLQYRGTENLHFKFVSSQNSNIWFKIPIKDDDVDITTYSKYDWVYDFFRDMKYDHIKENHPTVYSEIR